jgi:hypothetical protein
VNSVVNSVAATIAAGAITSPQNFNNTGQSLSSTDLFNAAQAVWGLSFSNVNFDVPTDPPVIGGVIASLLEVQPTTVFKYRLTQPSLVNAPTGTFNVVVTPIQGTIINPQQVNLDLEVTQYSAQSFTWIFTDANGNPVNLSGKTVELKAVNQSGALIINYQSGGPNLVIGGTSNNQVTVTFNPADTQISPQNLFSTLWNVTDKLPLSEGTISFKPAVAL